MNEQKNKNKQEESPKNLVGEPIAPVSSWKKAMSKRWIYPAAYVAAAAIILALVWVYQDSSHKETADNTPAAAVTDDVSSVQTDAKPAADPNAADQKDQAASEEAVETTAVSEDFVWPVAEASEVSIVKPFYDKDGSTEEHEAAMVQYNDMFMPNTGIDVARSDKAAFEVQAALGGKVTKVEQHALNGYTVEVTNANNLKTVYESLSDVKVKQGDEVKQGQTLASAGKNEVGKDLGNHLHFEVYENGEAVNPASLLPDNSKK
ncbi:M23 family metallopeptidase [Paenibacillus pinistramenti]|uniref:M23 family metallopeptidase n=1 Tax=Paenibacillus pinistramenti TaxID=1768003 RepID=UPI001109166E|nr:M23 family metallopeptidase [Paenibacillus pinistramenti]